MKTFFLAFHFEDLVNPILVKYQAEKDLRYEIEDCMQSYIEADTEEDIEYEDLINDIMSSFWALDWEFVPYSVIDVG